MTPPSQGAVQLRPGQIFDKYQIVSEVGRGATAVVYKAIYETPALSRNVALKVFQPDALGTDGLTRLRHEASMLSELDSEHIVGFYEASLFEAQPFLAMQWLEGETLQSLLQREGAVSWPIAVQMTIDVCQALQVAHDKRILHRDIKPSNCFRVVGRRNPYAVKVLDFGIARPYESFRGAARGTTTSVIIGTPHYIAPELLEPRPSWPRDERSDMYAVGVMLYQLSTGTVPYQSARSRTEVDYRTVHEGPQPPRERAPGQEIPAALEEVILRALQKDPRARFASMSEMESALSEIPGVVPVAAPKQPPSAPSRAHSGEIVAPAAREPSHPPPFEAAPARSTSKIVVTTSSSTSRRMPGFAGDLQNAFRRLSPQTRRLLATVAAMLVILAVLGSIVCAGP